MVKLTLTSTYGQTEGELIYVNPAKVVHVRAAHEGCYVHLGESPKGHGYGYWAKESAEEVVRMIEQSKQPVSTVTYAPSGSVMPTEPEDPEAHVIREPGVYRVKRVGRITTLERLDVGSDSGLVAGDNARLIAQAPEMYALLKELEWSTTFYNSNPCCPSCLRGEESGHEPTCRLAAVLKAVEGE